MSNLQKQEVKSIPGKLLIVKLKESTNTKLDKSEWNEIASCETILDPRFKKVYFENVRVRIKGREKIKFYLIFLETVIIHIIASFIFSILSHRVSETALTQ